MHELNRQRICKALDIVSSELLKARSEDGFWIGELSSSALSTATAVCALEMVEQARSASQNAGSVSNGIGELKPLITGGLKWLAAHANGDGGWGDTVRSLSNISTTALCWAAFGLVRGADETWRPTVSAAERWLKQNAGRTEPAILAPALMNRYGKDRTFSVPILMTCALGRRLGDSVSAWKRVPQLPFELAACPRSWFAKLHLPVVSYALPALIAIGLARHHQLPSANPLMRQLRDLLQNRVLKVLCEIQPLNGGFLEAVPLTSFVIMALCASGYSKHPAVQKSVRFLVNSVRPDGSWPIDTNLATWLTTQATKALAGQSPGKTLLPPEAVPSLRWWILKQQFKTVHPYTQSPPGGWAWTDLPGGVPDADDTAGALLALRYLGEPTPEVEHAAQQGVEWLLSLQNDDGGIPTFCRGWGTLPFDRSGADLTAHAMRAWLSWLHVLPPDQQHRVQNAMTRAVQFLIKSQRNDGAWIPLWFGNQFASNDVNATYGTARVVSILPELAARSFLNLAQSLNDGVTWLVKAQNPDGSWGGDCGVPPSIEETSLAVEALADALLHPQALLPTAVEQAKAACAKGAAWLVDMVEGGAWQTPAPIGLYFAKLWYFEKLYPPIFLTAALSRIAELTEAHK